MPRVLIVDDSNLMRRILSSVIESMPGYEVADLATSAEDAEAKLDALAPDAVLLDVCLPGMDGITYLSRLRARRPVPVIVISSRGRGELSRTYGELKGDEVAFIEKPDGVDRTLDDFRRELGGTLQKLTSRPRLTTAERRAVGAGVGLGRCRLIAIGGSTGGVDAVTTVLSAVQGRLPPIVVVLHMPGAYTQRFAQRLASLTGHDVAEARDGETLGAGQIRIAPGGLHLEIEQRGGAPLTRLADTAPVSGHRPSVDVLFQSVARSIEKAAIGVILTGMGRDGADGMLAMRRAGALTFGQARESCVVYGMPKAAMELGAVERELQLDTIGHELMRALSA